MYQVGKQISFYFVVTDILFSFWFLVEIVARCLVAPWLWVFGPDWRWNLLDTLLVIFSFVDVLLSVNSGFNGVSETGSARILRLARFVRLVRLVHAIRIFHGLRI